MKRIWILLVALMFFCGCAPAQSAVTPTRVVLNTPTSIPTGTPLPTAEASFDGVRVTYVGNAGFLITAGDQKVLIDGLFNGFAGDYILPDYVQELLVNARPPFDNIDLILATHEHADHFAAAMVRRHMQINPQAVFVSTAQSTGQLVDLGERVIPLEATAGNPARAEVGGIQIEAIYLSHGVPPAGQPESVNLAYLVTVNGITLFHTGDIDPELLLLADLQACGLPEAGIELAFLSHFLLSYPQYRTLVVEGIPARYYIPIHYALTQPPLYPSMVRRDYPDAVMFEEEMQNWVMP